MKARKGIFIGLLVVTFSLATGGFSQVKWKGTIVKRYAVTWAVK